MHVRIEHTILAPYLFFNVGFYFHKTNIKLKTIISFENKKFSHEVWDRDSLG